jgi:hypothetical protein
MFFEVDESLRTDPSKQSSSCVRARPDSKETRWPPPRQKSDCPHWTIIIVRTEQCEDHERPNVGVDNFYCHENSENDTELRDMRVFRGTFPHRADRAPAFTMVIAGALSGPWRDLTQKTRISRQKLAFFKKSVAIKIIFSDIR